MRPSRLPTVLTASLLPVCLLAACKREEATRVEKAAPGADRSPAAPSGAVSEDCAEVARRAATVLREEMDGPRSDDDPELGKLDEVLEGRIFMEMAMRNWIRAMCEQGPWPSSVRDCFRAVRNVKQFDRCEERMPDRLLERIDRSDELGMGYLPAPAAPPPTWSRNKRDCAAAARQVVALAEWQLSGLPQELRAETRRRLAGVAELLEADCVYGEWSEAEWCMLDPTPGEKRDLCDFYAAMRPSDAEP